jgi:aconitate hydratase
LTELVKAPTIVAPPVNDPLPESLEGRVAIVVGDDVSTGDMAPDGAVGMSLWSDIPACATFMFRRLDPDFYERVRSWGGGFIIAGHNYGQGSSREQAALAPVHLGIRAILAKSFARIHRSNLIAHGVVPLRFADEGDQERLPVGETLRIEGLRRAVSTGAATLRAIAGDGIQVALALEFAPRERKLLLAGGMLRWLR